MEGGHYCPMRRGGQFPRASKMAAIRCNGWGKLGTEVMSGLNIILPLRRGWIHLTFALHQPGCSEHWHCIQSAPIALTLLIRTLSDPTMPRERGRPCHGPAWYSFVARQWRVQRLEQALSIARTQRREKPRTSPMAYVEEDIPEEPIQVPPESLLFTVPDNWQPPSHIPASTSASTIIQQAQEAREETTCIIEEEFPEEFLHLDPEDTIQTKDSATKELRAVEAMEAAQEDSGEAAIVLGMEVEGGPVLAPPPLSTLPDFGQEPPPFFHPEQLALVFELRSHMADQIHRDTLMHQQIDMLYEAYSNAPTTQLSDMRKAIRAPAQG
jgi:hypothetical protein